MLSHSFVLLALGLAVTARPLRTREQAQQLIGNASVFHPTRATCGSEYGDNDLVAAVSRDFFDAFGDFADSPPDNPVCLYKISVASGSDPSKEIGSFTISEVCEDCTLGDIQLSPAAMATLGDEENVSWQLAQSDFWPLPNDIPVPPPPLFYDVTLASRPTPTGSDQPIVTTLALEFPCGGAHFEPSGMLCASPVDGTDGYTTTVTATLYAPTGASASTSISETAIPTTTEGSCSPVVTTRPVFEDCALGEACPEVVDIETVTLFPCATETAPSTQSTEPPVETTVTGDAPVVTTIWGSTDCNANNKPGDPMRPCPPMPTSTVVTITPSHSASLPVTTSLSSAPVSTTGSSSDAPVVTTIWGSTDCNANNKPGEPMKPCPPQPTSTVVTLTPSATTASAATTTTADAPIVTTIWGHTDCNANNKPGEPMKPCPPIPTSTVVTLSPSSDSTVPTTTSPPVPSGTGVQDDPIVTTSTIWVEGDCNADGGVGGGMKPCIPPIFETTTIITLTPSQTVTSIAPSLTPTEALTACTASAFDTGAQYNGGDVVTYHGQNWRAKWWTEAAVPGHDRCGISP
ncbi:hypothetical protein EXIGLDRAFT_762549 [Exidia glandulosa HHB12029]|uniref:Chitin-binding type-3 domain-containing protein n=1 Tax=Exidia glandulosa HHB12029 TaxID=1314781 RepID=A0A165MLX1_EXIGL|nr:hypothetical protein EXIGLDRAFT_762549 [Exidia glandulosa HHB12029]